MPVSITLTISGACGWKSKRALTCESRAASPRARDLLAFGSSPGTPPPIPHSSISLHEMKVPLEKGLANQLCLPAATEGAGWGVGIHIKSTDSLFQNSVYSSVKYPHNSSQLTHLKGLSCGNPRKEKKVLCKVRLKPKQESSYSGLRG